MSRLFEVAELKAIKSVAKSAGVRPIDVARVAGVCKVATPQEGSKWTYGVVWSTQLGDIARDQDWTTYRDTQDNDNDLDKVLGGLTACLVLRQTSARKGLGIGYVYNDMKPIQSGAVLAGRKLDNDLADLFGGPGVKTKRKAKTKKQVVCGECLESPCTCDDEESNDAYLGDDA